MHSPLTDKVHRGEAISPRSVMRSEFKRRVGAANAVAARLPISSSWILNTEGETVLFLELQL